MNEIPFLKNYNNDLINILKSLNNYEDIVKAKKIFKNCKKNKGKIILFGNGGSAAISSHASVDLSKNAGIRSVNFNEADLITCLANDFSYQDWVVAALKLYADKNDILVLISSSGKSENHVRAAKYAKKKKIKLITLTGNSIDNPLKKINKNGLNFWVNSKSYNLIEIVHLYLLLSIVDLLIGKKIYSASKKII
jgi:D-sedoheptulose 7-phosphate isomerase